MGQYVRQDQRKSDYQERLDKELKDRLRNKAAEADRPDGVDDSAYVRDLKPTTTLAWVWAVIALVFIGILVWLIVSYAQINV